MDLYKICEDLIHDKVEIKDVINKYEISYFKLIDFIKKYCFHYKILIDEDIKKKLDAPLSEMLELRKQGISYGKLSEKYNCSLPTIRKKLIEYCNEYNYPIPKTTPCPKLELPMEEIYELKKQGMTYNDLASKYNCSPATIRTGLAEYCEENNCKIPETASWYKSIKLPMKEVYELKKQGMSYNVLSSKYNCSPATIRTKLIKYCEENNYSLQGKNIVQLPMKEVYELKKQGMSYNVLSSKYNCSLHTIRKRLIEYCKENNYPIPKTTSCSNQMEFPMKEVYELKKHGISYRKIASIYNCSHEVIRTRLVEYCRYNNYPIPKTTPCSKLELPKEEIYELKKQGMTYNVLASKYNCSAATIRTRLIEYCKENNYEIPERALCSKQIELPMEEIYELKKQGITYKDLASKYSCSLSTVKRRLIEYDEEHILRNKYLEILLYDFNLIQEDILNRKIGIFYEDRGKDQEESIALTKK